MSLWSRVKKAVTSVFRPTPTPKPAPKVPPTPPPKPPPIVGPTGPPRLPRKPTGFWRDAPPDEIRLYNDMLADMDRSSHSDAVAMARDKTVQMMYHNALWNFTLDHADRATIYQAFEDYMMDEYGIDWDDFFDWDAYRDSKDRAS